MTSTEKAIRDFCGHHADWWPSTTQVQAMLALAQPEQEPWPAEPVGHMAGGVHPSKMTKSKAITEIYALFSAPHNADINLTGLNQVLDELMAQPEQEPVVMDMFSHTRELDSLRNTIQALSEANEAWSTKVKSLKKSQAQPNQFKPDYNTEAVLVEEMQRMAKRIEDLETLLERQTARIVDLQTHIENFDGEDR